jgi:polyphenol oxidase
MVLTGIHTSTVKDGNMDFRFSPHDEVLRARADFFGAHAVSLDDSVWMKVAHGTDCIIVEGASKKKGAYEDAGIVADALITQEKGLILCLLTADCVPLVLRDDAACVCALVHLGWRSAQQGLLPKVITMLTTECNAIPQRIHAYIGPSIQSPSYVHPDAMQRHLPEWAAYVREASDGFHIDIPGFVCGVLQAHGINTITDTAIDTMTDTSYFSHTRSKKMQNGEGRMVTAVVMQ